jgi:uncharacterized protein YecE (DUF72 family)
MEFGRPEKGFHLLDHRLPADGRLVAAALEGQELGMGKFHVGLGRWGRKEWTGHLYPEKMQEKDFLGEYAKHFDCIELGATFFSLPDQPLMAKWKLAVELSGNSDFIFMPKLSREITHIRKLKESSALTDQFMESVLPFGKYLGPILVQVGDLFGPRHFEDLKRFIEALPKTHSFFFELRHPGWFSDAAVGNKVFSLLREHGVGSVITDASGRPDCLHMELTTPDLYVRFNGNSREFRQFDFQRVDQWIDRIIDWRLRGLRNVYFIVHQIDVTDVPALAAYVVAQLNERLGTGLASINWQD